MKNNLAAEILQANGISYDSFRALLEDRPVEEAAQGWPTFGDESPDEIEAEAPLAAAPTLVSVVSHFGGLVETSAKYLRDLSKVDAVRPLAKLQLSRAEALGHLVDWATAHHHWFARALAEPRLVAGGCPQESWARVQGYGDYPWEELVSLWEEVNRLLIHVIAQMPESKLDTLCKVGVNEPVSLSRLVEDYVEYCENLLGQILALG